MYGIINQYTTINNKIDWCLIYDTTGRHSREYNGYGIYGMRSLNDASGYTGYRIGKGEYNGE